MDSTPRLLRLLSALVMASAAFVLAAAAPGCGGPAPPQNETAVEAAAASAPTPAPVPTPRTSVNALMVTMIDNSGHVLWDTEKANFKPRDEADWLELEDHATQLVAASTLIQLGGTGQADNGWIRQVGWTENAGLMGDAGLAALAAAKSRNLDALVKANGTLVDSCEGCHKAFKPELPTEGIVHQRPHSESHRGNR